MVERTQPGEGWRRSIQKIRDSRAMDAVDAGQQITRHLLRFVAASATSAFVFMFMVSGTIGFSNEVTYNIDSWVPLPKDPIAMMAPVYVFAIVTLILVIARAALRITGLNRHWAIPVAALLTGAISSITSAGKGQMPAHPEFVLGIALMVSLGLLIPVSVSAWVLEATNGGEQ